MRLRVDGRVVEEVFGPLHVIRFARRTMEGPAEDAIDDGTVDAGTGFAQDDSSVEMVDDHVIIGAQVIVEIELSVTFGSREELPIV